MGDVDDDPLNARLLTPGEVATKFRVNPKTVARWAAQGLLARIRTPSGHSRYREEEIRELLQPQPARPAG